MDGEWEWTEFMPYDCGLISDGDCVPSLLERSYYIYRTSIFDFSAGILAISHLCWE